MPPSILYNQSGITLTLDANSGGVHTILLSRGENLFNPTLITSLSSALQIVEDAPHPKALVITAASSSSGGKVNKFFSNGLDLNWMLTNPTHTSGMIESVWRLLSRLLVLDCRTVAAINGHAFGAGLFLALACDYRIMRTERGYVNFPELNLGMRLAKGFAELAKAKLTPSTLREGVLVGKRYGSSDAVRAGLVDEECSVEELLGRAEEIASAGLADNLGLASFDASSFRQMKIELYTDAYRALKLGSVDAEPESRL